jgi:hypothetical protein
MPREPINFTNRSSLTRVSVAGGDGHFMVRIGSEVPMRVWVGRDGLHCECGKPRCQHISSVVMCGFVEESLDERQAA